MNFGMRVSRKHRVASLTWGAVVGVVGTLLTVSWSSYGIVNIHDAIGWPLRVVSCPFMVVGPFVTYFLIVGDNYQPADFFRYTLPINLVINVVVGALLGWAWHAWQQRSARNV